MVGVSASVNLPLHHKVQKFSSGTGSPGWPRKKGYKMVVVVVSCYFVLFMLCLLYTPCSKNAIYCLGAYFITYLWCHVVIFFWNIRTSNLMQEVTDFAWYFMHSSRISLTASMPMADSGIIDLLLINSILASAVRSYWHLLLCWWIASSHSSCLLRHNFKTVHYTWEWWEHGVFVISVLTVHRLIQTQQTGLVDWLFDNMHIIIAILPTISLHCCIQMESFLVGMTSRLDSIAIIITGKVIFRLFMLVGLSVIRSVSHLGLLKSYGRLFWRFLEKTR